MADSWRGTKMSALQVKIARVDARIEHLKSKPKTFKFIMRQRSMTIDNLRDKRNRLARKVHEYRV